MQLVAKRQRLGDAGQFGCLPRSVSLAKLVSCCGGDEQGFELTALQGCEELLDRFEWVYAECSFIELYEGQALADEVIAWLRERGLRPKEVPFRDDWSACTTWPATATVAPSRPTFCLPAMA